MQTNEDLQSQLQGMQQELSAEQTACENARVQASEAEQSASSLESRLQNIRQLMIERQQDHLVAAADLRSESQAAQGSLETTRQTIGFLQLELSQAQRSCRCLQEVSTYLCQTVCIAASILACHAD